MGKDKDLEDKRLYSEKTLEQQIVYISSGGLVLTLGFSEKLICLSEGKHLEFLILTWCLFALAIFCNLLAQLTSVHTFDKLMVGAKSGVTWNNITKGLQIVSILSILFAIISFIIYLLKNIQIQ